MSASIRTKSINQRELRAQGIAVQMISCSSHWEKSPGGGEILSGWLLTLPWLHPHSQQYLRFSLLNKTIVIDCTLMDARSLQQHWLLTLQHCTSSNSRAVVVFSGFLLHLSALQGIITSKYPQTLPLVCRECVGQASLFFLPNYENINVVFLGVGNYNSSKLPG